MLLRWGRIAGWIGIALTVVSICGDLAFRPPFASNGYVAYARNGVQIVDRVEPHSAAAVAGIRPGDRIALAENRFAYRVRQMDLEAAGDVLPVLVTRGARTRRVDVVALATPAHTFGTQFVYQTIRVVLITLGGLILLRRFDRPDARALASFYIWFAFGFLARPPWFGEALRAAIAFVRLPAVLFSLASLAQFFAIFPARSVEGVRARIPRIAMFLTIAGVLTLTAINSIPIAFGIDPLGALGDGAWENALVAGFFVVQLIFVAVAAALGSRIADATDRARLRWLAVSFGIGFAGLAVAVGLELAGVPEQRWFLVPMTLLAIPLGSTYAILRHRVIDVGFVVNRALVFATVSGIIVFAFAMLEFVLGKYLVSFGHVQSIVLEAALALAIALTINRLHVRVDRFVDSVLFRQRHLAERALRRVTRETAYFTDPSALGVRVVETARSSGRFDFVALAVADSEGVYRVRWRSPGESAAGDAIDENDPAIVRLRTFREPVVVADLEADGAASSLEAQHAFPMLVRGELLGFLACGARTDGEALVPDERTALGDLALATGVAMDALRTTALRRAVDRVLMGDAPIGSLREAASFDLAARRVR